MFIGIFYAITSAILEKKKKKKERKTKNLNVVYLIKHIRGYF